MNNKELKEVQLQAGDVLHCTSNGFLARAIQWFTKSRVNHTALVVEVYGELFIIDSQRDGTNLRPLVEWANKYNYEYVIHRAKRGRVNIKDIQVRAISKVGHTKYDFAALLWHQPIYQLTGKWVGRRHRAEEKLFCSEYVAWVYNVAKWWKLSPQALLEHMDNTKKFYRV